MMAAAKCLVNKGANVNVCTEYGTTTLFFAARRGNAELVEMLLEMPSVDVNKADNSLVSFVILSDGYILEGVHSAIHTYLGKHF